MLKVPTLSSWPKQQMAAISAILGGVALLLDTISRIDTLQRMFRWSHYMAWSNHILGIIGSVFIVLGVIQYITARRSTTYCLRAGHVSIENCSLSGSLDVLLGQTHRVAVVSFLNDPHSAKPAKLTNVVARLTYYDSNGTSYYTIDNGLWKPSSSIQWEMRIGESASVVVAVQHATGKATAIGFQPYVPDQPLEKYQTELRDGKGEVEITLSHYLSQDERANERFRFALNTGKHFSIEPTR